MADLDKTADRLEHELADTRAEIDGMDQEIFALTQDNDDEGGAARNHMGDEGSNDYEMERLMSLQGELRARVQLMEDARQRITDGTYGTCLRCGNPIPAERLEVLPFAAYDVECQEIVDREGDITGVTTNEPLTADTAPTA